MTNWLVSPVFWLIIAVLVFFMLWRDRAAAKRIAGWMNRVCAGLQKASAGINACPGMVFHKSISAVVFIFQPVGDEDRFRLRSCSGWVEYQARFHESRMYEFVLDGPLTAGGAEVLLMDEEKREILKLNRHQPAGRAELDGKKAYYLHWEFGEASGSCGLRW